jgi:arabinose-5-phosphate isomerase
MNTDEIIAKGRRCIDIEADALIKTSEQLDSDFAEVASALIDTVNQGNKLILSGIGKSAHIARKLVGTFNSIGAPASFLDPVNALHGDMGLCREGDALLAFSNSGETEELLRLVPLISRFNILSIAVTSKKDSSLAQLCQNSLVYSRSRPNRKLDRMHGDRRCRGDGDSRRPRI